MRATGRSVVWRCHVGLDHPNDSRARAWDFLRPYVESADASSSRARRSSGSGSTSDRVWIVPPSIDAFSPKNQELDAGDRRRDPRARSGLDRRPGESRRRCSTARTARRAGSTARAELLDRTSRCRPARRSSTQVSRWDRLKDPVGVLSGFAEQLRRTPTPHLVLAGPAVAAVADDPEGAEVLAEVREARDALPERRPRAHPPRLACRWTTSRRTPRSSTRSSGAPTSSSRRASPRASASPSPRRCGRRGRSSPAPRRRHPGPDRRRRERRAARRPAPTSTASARRSAALLADPARATAIGEAAHERVRDEFLGSRHLIQYVDLLGGLLARSPRPPASP